MASAEVGRLFIRVMPDLDGFRAELKRKVEQIEDRMGPIEIEVVVDPDQAEQEVDYARRKMEQSARPVEIPLSVDSENAVEEAKATNEKIDKALDKKKVVEVEVRKQGIDTLHKELQDTFKQRDIEINFKSNLDDVVREEGFS